MTIFIIAVSINIAMGIGNWAFRHNEQGSDLPELSDHQTIAS